MQFVIVLVTSVLCLLPGSTRGGGQTAADSAFILKSHQHAAASAETSSGDKTQAPVGVDEKPGNFIDLDATFQDENGRELRLGDFIKKPTLILPVYYYCPRACSTMLANLASAVNKVPLTPGKAYQMLAVSFDADETPELANEAKKNYWPIIEKDFPKDQWLFLTGAKDQIDILLQDLGYRLKKTGEHTFIHPNVLIVVSPKGKIIRYLYGVYFLPFDIGMALTEASRGTPQLSIRKVLTYCFDYDSEKKTYVFKAFRVVAVTILFFLAVFMYFLLRKGSSRRTASRRHEGETRNE